MRSADTGTVKRKANSLLAGYLDVPLDHPRAIRPEEGYRAKSYNLPRQVTGLVQHLFVEYRVPTFLFRTVLSPAGQQLVFGDVEVNDEAIPVFREWFLTAASGGSFAKLAKEWLTKREAHWFLLAPEYGTIGKNLLWARAAAAGVPLDGCDSLVDIWQETDLDHVGDRLPDLLRFYAGAWSQMGRDERVEIADFLRAAVQDHEFSLKGRTYGSMRKLCDEWHKRMYSGTVRTYRSWQVMFEPWEQRNRKQVVRAIELTNNRALADEGRKQRHCVFTYCDRCINNLSRIVSFRWSMDDVELTRITVEVSPGRRQVAQIRGHMNRRATDDELKIVATWAGEVGYRMPMWG